MLSATISVPAGLIVAEASSQSVDTGAPVPVTQLKEEPSTTIDVP